MHRIISISVAVIGIILWSSCKPEKLYDRERVDVLRSQAERLILTQSIMGYNNWVMGDPSNQDSLYKTNAGLFTRENIGLLLQAETAETSAVQKQRLWYFRRYLINEYVGKEIASLTDKINNIEASTMVTVEGKPVAYRQVGVMIANEPDQARRAMLYQSLDGVLDSLILIQKEVEAKNQSLAKELGFASYNAMAEELKQFSLIEFKAIAERVLAQTEEQYTTLLREIVSAELKVPLDRFYRYDTGMLFRSRRFDKYFPEESMMEVFKKTYKTLGIDVDTLRNLRIDAEKRESKNPRAVCFSIVVPTDVRLSIKPIGGFDDYSALFHEVGHGMHYAHTAEHAFEFKYLGEYTVTETYAFLSEYILANQAWLRLNSTMPTPVLKDFLRMRAFQRLYMIRRYAAKFLYEWELHSGASNPDQIYASMLSKAAGHQEIPSDRKRYLTDLDALYYSATYLRAWFLEAQFNAKLSKDHGVNWFENPEAGKLLLGLWLKGDRINGEDLVRSLGYERISPDALIEQIKLMVLMSTKPTS